MEPKRYQLHNQKGFAYSIAALITAAGNSHRFGTGSKKEYVTYKQHSIIYHSIRPFTVHKQIRIIIVTHPQGHQDRMSRLLETLPTSKSFIYVKGGQSQQESVYFGLQALEGLNPDIVLIHDGARPWISENLITQIIHGATRYGACVPVTNSTDALKHVGSDGFIQTHLDRGKIFCAQTPQGFRYQEIYQAHRQASESKVLFPDDTQVYSAFVGPVFTIPGEPRNRKITYVHDVEFYDAAYRTRI